MDLENKYYTPSPEDIRVGFEYEFHGMTTGGLVFFGTDDRSQDIEPNIKIWTPSICRTNVETTLFEGGQNFKTVQECLKNGQIRVPYLTAAQIEAEGWKLKNDDALQYHFERPNHPEIFLTVWKRYDPEGIEYDMKGGWIDLTSVQPEYGYSGFCKSINEFRTLCKWLRV